MSLSNAWVHGDDGGWIADRDATESFVASSMAIAAMLPAMIPRPPSRPTLCAPTRNRLGARLREHDDSLREERKWRETVGRGVAAPAAARGALAWRSSR